MDEQKFCRICKQKTDCQNVYRAMGHAESPSVTARIVLAFLLPLIVFIVSLGASERILTRAIHRENVLTALSFLLALSVTFACIVLTRKIRRRCRQGG